MRMSFEVFADSGELIRAGPMKQVENEVTVKPPAEREEGAEDPGIQKK